MSRMNNDLRISFNYKFGCIRIFKKVIEQLDHPKYVFFSLNPENTVLTIHGTEERNNDCLLVERHREYKRTEGLKFSGKAFIRKISECVGWDLDKRYVVIGEYDESNRSIDFDLTTASCDLQG